MLKIAVQMDPVESINVKSDTSFALMLAAQTRGHDLYYYRPKDLSLINGVVKANLSAISLKDQTEDYFQLGAVINTDLSAMDVVLMRQDPPYDMNYLTYTYLLEKIHPETFVINNPSEVRNCPEKIFVFEFSEFMPDTLITSDQNTVKKFQEKHGNIILKPLYAHGGADVFKAGNNYENIFHNLVTKYNQPIIAQQFLPKVTKGDKRIILIDGEFAGAINRVPKPGEIRSNMAVGGVAEKTKISEREKQICAAVGPRLKEKNIILAGLDVIDGHLTEINITSPTGLRSIDALYGENLGAKFWQAVEGRLSGGKR